MLLGDDAFCLLNPLDISREQDGLKTFDIDLG